MDRAFVRESGPKTTRIVGPVLSEYSNIGEWLGFSRALSCPKPTCLVLVSALGVMNRAAPLLCLR